ncbi:MAG TPA: hypothetical protein VGD91_16675 [Trebonia sp.]
MPPLFGRTLPRSPANCAFHLRTLAKYGFVEEAGGGRGRERPWRATNQNVSISSHQADPQAAMAADALSRLWFDQWVDRARLVFGSGSTLPGWENAIGWGRSAVYLTPEETMSLSRRIRDLIKEYEPRRENPGLRPPGVFRAPEAGPAASPPPGTGAADVPRPLDPHHPGGRGRAPPRDLLRRRDLGDPSRAGGRRGAGSAEAS